MIFLMRKDIEKVKEKDKKRKNGQGEGWTGEGGRGKRVQNPPNSAFSWGLLVDPGWLPQVADRQKFRVLLLWGHVVKKLRKSTQNPK